ncbi:AAA family ATPase [Candidatus Halocynthiibacter alkanivorans]|uniref:AAA family ATPase n=1 Tax=Candidatus Halocynthiibacter alkanivorans TaxID=2267619 RepID=UPI0013599064|nr:AAA family ATPase [Candidatus Halocynthiibacter alkanivorans]
MTNTGTSIILISGDTRVSAAVSRALNADPHIALKQLDATLARLNGTAVQLVQEHDLVLFHTDSVRENDISTIQRIREGLGETAILIALTGGDTSLDEAQELIKAGVNDVVSEHLSETEIKAVVDRWVRVIKPEPSHGDGSSRKGQVISVAQSRGGIGATTLAVNLADRLLDRTGFLKKTTQNRVVLVDLDIQFGTVASFLDIDSSDLLYRLAIDGEDPDAVLIQQSLSALDSGLSVLTAPSRMAPLEALSKCQIATLLSLLQENYDYVVVSLPRSLVAWIAQVLECSDKLLVVTDSSVPAIRQTRRLIDVYSEDHLNLPIEIVIGHEAKPMFLAAHHKEAVKVLDKVFQHWIPYDPVAAREAVDRGQPLSLAAPKSRLAKSINQLGKETLIEMKSEKQTKTIH